MKLSTATLRDKDALLPLVRAYHAFEKISLTDTQRLEALAPLLEDDSELGRIWLVRSQDMLVGYVAICFGYSIEFGGRDAFVDELYIVESARGRGIGTAVLEATMAAVSCHGVRALHLEVASTNAPARRLYSSIGFESREQFHLMSYRLESSEAQSGGRRRR